MNATHSDGLSGDGAFVSSLRRSKQPTLDCRIGRIAREHAVGLGMSPGASAFRAFAIGAACIGILLVDAEAAVTFSNPFRSVSAGNNKGSSQAIETHGYDPFNQSARVDWEEYWSYPHSYGPYPNTTGHYFSKATQESIISLTGISARGSVVGTGSEFFYGENRLLQNSRSYFRINILLDDPGNIHLNGLIEANVDSSGANTFFSEMVITLAGVNGEYYSRSISPSGYGQTYKLNETFALASGEYEFMLSLTTDENYQANEIFYDDITGDVYIDPGYGVGGYVTYDITLVPEPSSMFLAALGGLLILTRRAR